MSIYVFPINPLKKMAERVTIIPPGTYQHHIYTHRVGPTGANGTQVFPKLTDNELMCILRPLIHKKIIDKYCTGGSKEKNAQIILANLTAIVPCTEDIFCCVKKEYGYCSCECLRAIHHNQVAAGHACDLVFRALMICFTFADLKIQLDEICHKEATGKGTHTTPSRRETVHNELIELMEKLDKLQKESDAIQEAITRKSKELDVY
jgi:hypothetical protein